MCQRLLETRDILSVQTICKENPCVEHVRTASVRSVNLFGTPEICWLRRNIVRGTSKDLVDPWATKEAASRTGPPQQIAPENKDCSGTGSLRQQGIER